MKLFWYLLRLFCLLLLLFHPSIAARPSPSPSPAPDPHEGRQADQKIKSPPAPIGNSSSRP
ncbi:hypothetical protein G2W53_030171 [Senna tora]|uniref:Uncharacterized protein n=1 Tax=Senna tora TaxID=362788 RepID=A0A834WBD7_9FABA|nr:hypothetical protein G2W53_030171 [Senna tora]